MSVYIVESQSAIWLIFTSFPVDFVFIQDRKVFCVFSLLEGMLFSEEVVLSLC